MKRWLQWTVAIILIGSLTIQADPFKTWSWTEVTEYENNLPTAGDSLSYHLLCGVDPGGPYDQYEGLLDEVSPSVRDMGPLVMNTPGTYYCVATATSLLWGTVSAYSNEVSFTVLPTDLGLRPKATVLTLS